MAITVAPSLPVMMAGAPVVQGLVLVQATEVSLGENYNSNKDYSMTIRSGIRSGIRAGIRTGINCGERNVGDRVVIPVGYLLQIWVEQKKTDEKLAEKYVTDTGTITKQTSDYFFEVTFDDGESLICDGHSLLPQ